MATSLLSAMLPAMAVNITFDHRSLMFDGERKLLISTSIHYPRSVPEMWPKLVKLAKEGGADVIESYVFWNGHELSPGKYNIEYRFDLVKFVKIVQDAGMYMMLRIGPFVAAEWNYGYVMCCFTEGYLFGYTMSPDVCSGQQPNHTWYEFVVSVSCCSAGCSPLVPHEEVYDQNSEHDEEGKAFCISRGSNYFIPGATSRRRACVFIQIISYKLRKVENEYGGWYEEIYGEKGKEYAMWAAHMALSQNTGVPWVMCVEQDAPYPVIDTCNSFYCDQFAPNNPLKPKIWTENWPGWYMSFGSPIPHRPPEDIAFSVALFLRRVVVCRIITCTMAGQVLVALWSFMDHNKL